jgi:pSer/pThr/pTyr-binding forkhead associated (FHA) protein
MHAKLMKKEDGLYLLDLNSTNGTFLNGESLISGEDVKIEEGDIVAFAKCEYMVVQG